MTLVVSQKTLDSIRAADDAPVASCHGYDVFATLNAQYESINESAGGGYAPGALVGTVDGHIHDHNGDGRGITRGMIGEGYITPPYISRTTTTVTFESIATTVAAQYPTVVGGKAIIHAFASPGVETVSVTFCIKASLSTNIDYQVTNLTDAVSTASTDTLDTTPKWITEDVTVTPVAGACKEIDIDIEVRTTTGVAKTFILYYAFAFERTVAP
jgi:hypothetical protein